VEPDEGEKGDAADAALSSVVRIQRVRGLARKNATSPFSATWALPTSQINNRQSSFHYGTMGCAGIGDRGRNRTQIVTFSVRCKRVGMEHGFRWVSVGCAAIRRGRQVDTFFGCFARWCMFRLTHLRLRRPENPEMSNDE